MTRLQKRILGSVGWCVWLVVAWVLSSLICSFVAVYIYRSTQVDVLNSTVGVATLQVLQLVIMLAAVVNVPYRFGSGRRLTPGKRRASKMHLLGIARLPGLVDVLPIVLSVAAYYAGAFVLTLLASTFLPHDLIEQSQNVGFATANNSWGQVVLIIVILVVVTPIFEELIFRGFLLGRLQHNLGFWTAAIIVSLIFAVGHGQVNVGLTTFVLSMIACYVRRQTGAIWAGVGLHMLTNLVAASLVFVLPMLS